MKLNICISGCPQRILDIITSEPELPGNMPDEIWEAIRDDRDAAEEAMRIAVRATKMGIKRKIMEVIKGGGNK